MESTGMNPTPVVAAVSTPSVERPDWRVRFLVSREYSWLWFAQVVSALGDWIGLLATTALAAEISGAPEAATALVLTARVAPSFFIGPFMGVLVDRYDRRLLMRIADIARALVFVALPFVSSLWGLIVASLLLEIFTLLWSPAKEALVPGLVPRERLTTANSLGVLAAYGTFPLAGALAYLLKLGNQQLAKVEFLDLLQFNRSLGKTQALPFYFDALTFLVTAFIVWRFVHPRPATGDGSVEAGGLAGGVAVEPTAEPVSEPVSEAGSSRRAAIGEIREGWRFIFQNPVVRAVNVGLAAGLLGGAMLVPLGPTFAKQVIGEADAFSLYITALGLGVAIGVGVLTALQQRIPKERVFVVSLLLSGCFLLAGVSMSTLVLSSLFVFLMGIGAGSVYVLGYTLLQENTEDDLRGRTFTTFLTLVRLCVLGAMVLGPTLSSLLGPVMKQAVPGRSATGSPAVHAFGVTYAVPGARLVLWFGGVLVVLASLLAARSIQVKLRGTLRDMAPARREAHEDD